MDKLNWTKIIAASEIIGGCAGLAAVSFLVGVSLSSASFTTLLSTLFLLIPFFLSIYAGWLLWVNGARGLSLSTIVQALQIIQLKIPGLLSYKFVSGLEIPLILEVDPLTSSISTNFSLGLSGSFDFSFGGESQFLFAVNFAALAAIYYLSSLSKSQLSSSSEDGYEEDELSEEGGSPDETEDKIDEEKNG